MIEIEKFELTNIYGGLNVSGALINSFTSGVKVVLELGRSLGSAIRRISSGSLCKI